MQKTKYRATRIPLLIGGELMCSGRVRRSCSTSDARRVTLITKPDITLFQLSYIKLIMLLLTELMPPYNPQNIIHKIYN